MNDVFSKIIEKLEEAKGNIPVNRLLDDIIKEKPKELGQLIAYDKAIEIVKQEAEQFGTDTNVGSNGWIPASERLPENGGYYLVTYHEWSKGNFLPKYNNTYVRKMHYQKSERFTGWNYPRFVDDREENDTNREVIAWMKLPEVYKN